jgi:hypothetical protein
VVDIAVHAAASICFCLRRTRRYGTPPKPRLFTDRRRAAWWPVRPSCGLGLCAMFLLSLLPPPFWSIWERDNEGRDLLGAG